MTMTKIWIVERMSDEEVESATADLVAGLRRHLASPYCEAPEPLLGIASLVEELGSRDRRLLLAWVEEVLAGVDVDEEVRREMAVLAELQAQQEAAIERIEAAFERKAAR